MAPRLPHVVGRTHLADEDAFGVPPVELGGDVGADVDVVDDDPADSLVPGEVDVVDDGGDDAQAGDVGVAHGRAGQVDLAERRPGEVDPAEGRASEGVGVLVLLATIAASWHGPPTGRRETVAGSGRG